MSTAIVSVLVLVLYGLLVSNSPAFGWLFPRGGAASLGVSLLLTNAAVWVSQQPSRTASERFQLVLAGWTWLLVQFGSIYYLYKTMV